MGACAVEETNNPAGDSDWPNEVNLVLSALEAGRQGPSHRRARERTSYRVRALLRLFSDDPQTPPWVLYTRDVNPRGLGFVSAQRLPLGHGGSLEISLPGGRTATLACTLLRCRQAAPGWYDGALYFNRDQMDFDQELVANNP